MPRGQPDYGMYAVKDVTASISDMGEVAARLGSIVTYDKRGDVVDFDNFEGAVLKWLATGAGAGRYGRLSSESVKSGSQAVELYTPDIVDSSFTLQKLIPILASRKLGVEISFSKLDLDLDLHLVNVYTDGAIEYQAYGIIDPTNLTLSIYTTDWALEKVADIKPLYSEVFLFHTIKLVADFETGFYKRIMLDKNEWDIESIPMPSDPVAPSIYLLSTFAIKNRATDGGKCWFDDFIFTQAEP